MRQGYDLAGRKLSYLDAANPRGGAVSAEQTRGGAGAHASAVLFLHAFPLAADMWRPQLAAVPSGWRFIAPDCRGFGDSAPDEGSDFSIDDYARDALALLDHLRIRQAVVCGLSMGGYAAFALFRLAPDRVRGLVLADTRPDADTPAARAARDQSLDLVAREGVGALAEAMLPRLLGRTSTEGRPDVVDAVRRLAAAQAPAAVRAAIIRLMKRPDSTSLLADIACPTLVLAGDEDEITGEDIARQMHGQIGNAALAIIGRAGHLSNLEQPQAFNEALDRFLAARFRS